MSAGWRSTLCWTQWRSIDEFGRHGINDIDFAARKLADNQLQCMLSSAGKELIIKRGPTESAEVA